MMAHVVSAEPSDHTVLQPQPAISLSVGIDKETASEICRSLLVGMEWQIVGKVMRRIKVDEATAKQIVGDVQNARRVL